MLKDCSVFWNHAVEYVCGRIKKFLKFGHTEITMLPVEVMGVVFLGGRLYVFCGGS